MTILDINLEKYLLRLVDIGLRGNFDELADLSDFQDHRSVCHLADRHRHTLMCFASKLSDNDRIAFIKSIAMLEHRVGGMGSVTSLKGLLSLVSDPERLLLDWILRNTRSYWYYAHGARSIEQLDSENAWHATLTARRVAKDRQRQLEEKKRIAETATHNLYNAVRRGDVKAVRSLVSKGANTTVPSPDGRSMIDFASSLGHIAIAAELSEMAKPRDTANE